MRLVASLVVLLAGVSSAGVFAASGGPQFYVSDGHFFPNASVASVVCTRFQSDKPMGAIDLLDRLQDPTSSYRRRLPQTEDESARGDDPHNDMNILFHSRCSTNSGSLPFLEGGLWEFRRHETGAPAHGAVYLELFRRFKEKDPYLMSCIVFDRRGMGDNQSLAKKLEGRIDWVEDALADPVKMIGSDYIGLVDRPKLERKLKYYRAVMDEIEELDSDIFAGANQCPKVMTH